MGKRLKDLFAAFFFGSRIGLCGEQNWGGMSNQGIRSYEPGRWFVRTEFDYSLDVV